ncbi:MAG: hypothetical protein KF865_15170 [Bdellovibrionaceae bacterium]|nr:hypothetical protein [Pseudobdellovibrionaceae bacterium]
MTPPQIQHLTFGFKEHTADMLWLRAVQDFDYCENEIAKQTCQASGWLYHMLDTITDLAPHFRMPYATGGLALTVLVNDFPGASKIFDKGVERFPRDWPLLSRAAYHALYEEKDKPKAARLLKMAGEAGGPPWYFALATRLSNESGDIHFGEILLKQLESEPNTDPFLLKTLRERVQKAQNGATSPR